MESTRTPAYRRFLRRLRAARKEAGLTQVQVAKRLRRTQAFVSKSESGESREVGCGTEKVVVSTDFREASYASPPPAMPFLDGVSDLSFDFRASGPVAFFPFRIFLAGPCPR